MSEPIADNPLAACGAGRSPLLGLALEDETKLNYSPMEEGEKPHPSKYRGCSHAKEESSAEKYSEPRRRRHQLGESSPEGTQPRNLPSRQQYAEILSSCSHRLSSPSRERRNECSSRQQCVYSLHNNNLKQPWHHVLPVRL
jgi:hypothetical protein